LWLVIVATCIYQIRRVIHLMGSCFAPVLMVELLVAGDAVCVLYGHLFRIKFQILCLVIAYNRWTLCISIMLLQRGAMLESMDLLYMIHRLYLDLALSWQEAIWIRVNVIIGCKIQLLNTVVRSLSWTSSSMPFHLLCLRHDVLVVILQANWTLELLRSNPVGEFYVVTALSIHLFDQEMFFQLPWYAEQRFLGGIVCWKPYGIGISRCIMHWLRLSLMRNQLKWLGLVLDLYFLWNQLL